MSTANTPSDWLDNWSNNQQGTEYFYEKFVDKVTDFVNFITQPNTPLYFNAKDAKLVNLYERCRETLLKAGVTVRDNNYNL